MQNTAFSFAERVSNSIDEIRVANLVIRYLRAMRDQAAAAALAAIATSISVSDPDLALTVSSSHFHGPSVVRSLSSSSVQDPRQSAAENSKSLFHLEVNASPRCIVDVSANS
jgi:hypothetical protein